LALDQLGMHRRDKKMAEKSPVILNIGIGRDNLPYMEKMKLLVEQFNNITGLSLSELNVWSLLPV
jgi:hypothetical protein